MRLSLVDVFSSIFFFVRIAFAFTRVPAVVCLILLGSSSSALAQSDPASGVLPFSTHVGSSYESVDLATSNILVAVPVRDKRGKIPFSFKFLGNSQAYIYTNPQNNQNYWEISNGLTGVPFSADLGAGFGDSKSSYTCNGKSDSKWSNFVISDATGATHPLPSSMVVDYQGCYASKASAVTTDGSGYTLSVTAAPIGLAGAIYDRSGNESYALYPSQGVIDGTLVDPDNVTNYLPSQSFRRNLHRHIGPNSIEWRRKLMELYRCDWHTAHIYRKHYALLSANRVRMYRDQ